MSQAGISALAHLINPHALSKPGRSGTSTDMLKKLEE
jgi:hypothetical protein